MPRVINKVHISPLFEYIVSKFFNVSKTLLHTVQSRAQTFQKSNKQQRVIQVTAAERTWGRDEAAHIARL